MKKRKKPMNEESWEDDWSVDMLMEAAWLEKEEANKNNELFRKGQINRPCPGCGDPLGDCPNQNCVRDDNPPPVGYDSEPIEN